jgi:hypothetical protein
LWIGVLDYDHSLAAFDGLRLHSLLRTGLEGSFAFGFRAHALHSVHYVGLLRQKRVS